MNTSAEQKNISQLFRKWLLICIIIAFATTTAFIYILQTRMSENNSDQLLRLNIADVKQDITDASNENLLRVARAIAEDINTREDLKLNTTSLLYYLYQHNLSEINIIDENGIIISSNNMNFLNYDMNSGEQSRAFMVLLDGTKELVQSYQPTSYDADLYRKYAGVALEKGGFLQVGYNAERFHKDIAEQVIGATRNRHIGEGGSLIICDEKWNIVSDRHDYEGQTLEATGLILDPETMPVGQRFTATVYGKPSYCMYYYSEGFYMVGILPKDEAVLSRNVSVGVTAVMELLVFIALFCIVYILLKRQIVDNVRKMNQSLAEITGGNLDVVLDVRSNKEFSALSNDINTTVDALKQHIDEAAARIDQELEYAKSIQTSALPSVFPPFPHRHDFSIYAMMDPAKEVGGDFYDFYLLNENTLGFLIADVSGKGIPAAMFMMKAKTIFQDLAESGATPSRIFETANSKLCEGNDAMMFVTAWMGILDLKSGKLQYVNGGHNAPLLRRKNGTYEYLKLDPCFVLAALDGMNYETHEVELNEGDTLFLYTDGVTEALNTTEELFGEERLHHTLNTDGCLNTPVETLLPHIRAELNVFAQGAEQADDITMLGVTYHGPRNGGTL